MQTHCSNSLQKYREVQKVCRSKKYKEVQTQTSGEVQNGTGSLHGYSAEVQISTDLLQRIVAKVLRSTDMFKLTVALILRTILRV